MNYIPLEDLPHIIENITFFLAVISGAIGSFIFIFGFLYTLIDGDGAEEIVYSLILVFICFIPFYVLAVIIPGHNDKAHTEWEDKILIEVEQTYGMKILTQDFVEKINYSEDKPSKPTVFNNVPTEIIYSIGSEEQSKSVVLSYSNGQVKMLYVNDDGEYVEFSRINS